MRDNYKIPSDDMFTIYNDPHETQEYIDCKVKLLQEVFNRHEIDVDIVNTIIGATFSRIEFVLNDVTDLDKLKKLKEQIKLKLEVKHLILLIGIDSKNVCGIEFENYIRTKVSFKEVYASQDYKEQLKTNDLVMVVGKDIYGNNQYINLANNPQLLIGGSYAAGVSSLSWGMLSSLILTNSPKNLKILLYDPRWVDFATLSGIPHLLTRNVLLEQEDLLNSLQWVEEEIKRRYEKLIKYKTDNLIKEHNKLCDANEKQSDKIPYIVIAINEYYRMFYDRETKERFLKLIQDICEIGGPVGVYLLMFTSRLSVDVVLGTIKRYFPRRLIMRTRDAIESMVVLDNGDAVELNGYMDMIYYKEDLSCKKRIQGAFMASDECRDAITYIADNNLSYENLID